jgi:hypothetical protein
VFGSGSEPGDTDDSRSDGDLEEIQKKIVGFDPVESMAGGLAKLGVRKCRLAPVEAPNSLTARIHYLAKRMQLTQQRLIGPIWALTWRYSKSFLRPILI